MLFPFHVDYYHNPCGLGRWSVSHVEVAIVNDSGIENDAVHPACLLAGMAMVSATVIDLVDLFVLYYQ